MEADGRGLHKISPRCAIGPICDNSAPAWSPDGRLAINLSSGREKRGSFGGQIERSEIVVVDPERSTQRSVARLDDWQGDLRRPVWSPDGTQIAYEQLRSPLSGRDGLALHVVSIGDGTSRRITQYDLGAGDGPDWSTDGRRLLFRTAADQEADTATTDIAIVRADGSDRRRLTHSDEPGQVLSSSFSPDGDWIVYAARGTADRFDLYIMRTDGSASRPLTRTELWDSAPEWGAG